MLLNLYIIPFIIISGLLFSVKENKRSRLSYISLCSILLILIASLRSPEWMTSKYSIDTLNYKGYFERSFDMGWSEFSQSFYLRYFLGVDDFDMGFVALNRLISFFTHEFWAYSMVADLLFFVPFGMMLYRYTTNIWQIMFAFVFYVALVQIFLFAGARQMFSLGFDLMALLAIIDKKRIRAALFFLLGISIHFSSILFAIPLFMVWYGFKPMTLKSLHAVCLILFPVVLFFPNEIIRFMGDSVGMEKYSDYGKGIIQGGSETFIFLIETLSLFCFFAINHKVLRANQNIRDFYVMAPLLTFFAPLIISNGSMIRISLYFHLFLTLLVPYAIDSTFGNKRGIVYAGAIGIMSLLIITGGGIEYYFFWQR